GTGTGTGTRRGRRDDADKRNVVHLGMLSGGRIVAEQARRGPSSRSIAFSGGVTLAVAGLLVGLLLSRSASPDQAAPCTGGSLSLIGSTAFSPVAQQLAGAYATGCAAAHITVPSSNNGSLNGLAGLAAAGRGGKASGVIAMSDGPAPTGPAYAGIAGQAAAVIIFTMAVNADAGVYNLTTGQVRQIFDGQITNWRTITHGASLPVRIISREPGSGTRETFDKYVLGGAAEQAGTKSACNGQSLPSAPVIWCTDSTTKLLQVVADIPGAIGYAQAGDVTAYTGGGITAVSLDGLSGRFGDIGRNAGTYPFWTAEYLYTYGKPSPLASAFIARLASPSGISDLTAAGYAPCPEGGSSRAAALCAQAGG
ncbi:MAG: substrate-binding domain-containing protein, partial [Trebonia sp.]